MAPAPELAPAHRKSLVADAKKKASQCLQVAVTSLRAVIRAERDPFAESAFEKGAVELVQIVLAGGAP